MYMDNVKLFAKKWKELETLIQVVMIYSEDMRMEFSIKMSNSDNEKRKNANDKGNSITKSRKK